MSKLLMLAIFTICTLSSGVKPRPRIFDVHLHGKADIAEQVTTLKNAGVVKAALSTSWAQQNHYREQTGISFLYGLMLPCPNGKVPYSLQPCYQDGSDWPGIEWTETQIKEGKIDFLGEILSQYYGISSSDSLLWPYYKLAEKYQIPVGIHTGGAGPDHGSPNFKLELGDPLYIEKCLQQFPGLKIWLMHAGDGFYKQAIAVMSGNKRVFADISVISNPDIVAPGRFAQIMKAFVAAGLENQLMFGTDNGNIQKVIQAVEGLSFLKQSQKDKLYYSNAEAFFATKN